jgi:hypothetical protein
MSATIDQLHDLCKELHAIGKDTSDLHTSRRLAVLNLELLLLVREVEEELLPLSPYLKAPPIVPKR